MFFKNHPKALPILFLTEMWERFGFYVVQGLLVLYMSKALGFTDARSFTISGVFTALAYISPMIGGLIADRLLGFRLSILWGGLFLSIGYGLLALLGHNGFYLALATIIVGNGLFKPNISSLLGTLYTDDHASRDAGFTLFYVGINIGALLAALSSGFIQEHFGWHASFGLASAGLLFGLGIFATGLKTGRIAMQTATTQRSLPLFTKLGLFISCLLTIGLCSFIMTNLFASKWLLPLTGIGLLLFLSWQALHQPTAQRHRFFVLIFLIFTAIIYWALFLQIFFSANLFIDRLVARQLNHFTIPTTWFYGLESIFVILLGPFFAWSWQRLERHDVLTHPVLKAIIAIIFAGIGFATLALSTFFPNTSGKIYPLFIVIAYLFITVGELLISPIGLSAVTQLAPSRLVGMMMGIWFASLGFGGQFAGILAQLANVPKTMTTAATQLPYYRHAFAEFTVIAFIMASILFLLQKITKKWTKIH